ncbi:hypothetical protein BGZ99_008063 [Dissophora globulifera]|uniref:Uncharacterized protein n=1 Tax=Dissophora globulifera TaxID=979702 RepID=A0A9P6RAI6_9FUNG|nr:hypothetical protein BGZ99_008063 [Dissophora globulifera]
MSYSSTSQDGGFTTFAAGVPQSFTNGQSGERSSLTVSRAASNPNRFSNLSTLSRKSIEDVSPLLEHRQIPGQPAGLGVYAPHMSPFLIVLAIAVSSFFYVYFVPDTNTPPFVWIRDYFGMAVVTSCIHFAVFLHAFQVATAIYLMKWLAKCPFTFMQTLIWCVCIQFLGIASMLKLLPIVYESKFVSDEIEKEELENTQNAAEHVV